MKKRSTNQVIALNGLLILILVGLFQNCSGGFTPAGSGSASSASVTTTAAAPGDRTAIQMLSAASEDASVCKVVFDAVELQTVGDAGTQVPVTNHYDFTIRPTPPAEGAVKKQEMPVPVVNSASRPVSLVTNMRCPSTVKLISMHYRVPYTAVCTLHQRPTGEFFAVKSFEYKQDARDENGNVMSQSYFFTDDDVKKYQTAGCQIADTSEGQTPSPVVTTPTGSCTWFEQYTAYGVSHDFKDVQCVNARADGWECRYNGYPYESSNGGAPYSGTFNGTSYCKCVEAIPSMYNASGTCQQPAR